MNTVQEGVPDDLREIVELPHLTYVDKIWRLLEFSGKLDPAQRDELIRAMSDNRVAKTIEAGMEIDERVEFVDPAPGTTRPVDAGAVDHVLKGRERLPAGEKRAIAKKKDWNVSATALDENTCVVAASSALTVMADSASGLANASPEEMLLAGLASCTTVYIARNASFHEIPVDDVRVVVRAEVPDNRGDPISKVEKVAYVTGSFDAEQAAAIEGFAGYCAFGLTLGRGAALEDSVAIDECEPVGGAASALSALDRDAPVPDDPAYCNDGSCCVPAMIRADA